MSSIAWLDYSEHDRRKALDVIDLFREKDTRDELGIGTVRDAFANLLFPGTSTIQTRARYFFFVPWIYQKLERDRVSSAEIARWARNAEIRLIDALAESDDTSGTIGIDARKHLKRLPSSVYWAGLGQLGFRLFPGAQSQYHRSVDGYYRRRRRRIAKTEGEPLDPTRGNWHPSIPPVPSGFPKQASFSLTPAESEFFVDHLRQRVPNALLTHVMAETMPADSVPFVWLHPEFQDFPERNKKELRHARYFSEIIEGAAYLYNLMLAELANNDERVEQYLEAMESWAAALDAIRGELESWDRPAFWNTVHATNARVPLRTHQFIDAWLDTAISHGSLQLNRSARQLIHDRERTLKRGQARLDNPRALEMWGGAAGTAPLDYRWERVVQQHIRDVQQGLGA